MNATLPGWLTPLLPALSTPHSLVLAEDGFSLIAPDGETVFLPDLKAVADAINGIDVEIADEVYDEHAQGDRFFGLTYPVGKNFTGMVLTMTDEKRMDIIADDYEHSLRNSIRYENDPTNFYNSYYFIDTHPAFWTTHNPEVSPWYWTTSGHCEKVNQYVFQEDGVVSIGLETGQHVEEDYENHYHDYRLDVWGGTFEEAFVDLAALVYKFFYADGTERPDVEHKKPEWIIELEERIEEVDRASKEEDEA